MKHKEDYAELLNIIESFESIVIFGHIYPDGDCFGSQIALRNSLRLRYPNKEIYTVGSGIEIFKDFIGKTDEVSLEIIQRSLAIFVDASDETRIEDKRIQFANRIIKIDHHVDTGTFRKDFYIVNEKATSCCEIITDLIQKMNLPIDQSIANALCLGIITDTGRFSYIADYPPCFRQIIYLCEHGADPKTIIRLLNFTDEMSMAFKGFVFSNYKKTKDGVIYLILKLEDMKKFNLNPQDGGSMVNLISNVISYPVWAFFVEQENHTCHVEVRSNGPVIQPICAKYGGGGHKMAAGVTIASCEKQDIDIILNELNELVKNFKKEQSYVGK